nr:MAG TPA: baseplate wedge protein [Caudoviricetes sp.]
MAEKKISYLNRTFSDYKQALKEYIEEYYPQVADSLSDASIGSWLIDLAATIGDNLSFYIDRALAETNIDTAQSRNSILSIARSSGFKIPGPKGSMAEEEFSCDLPTVSNIDNSGSQIGMPNWAYAPILKKGTKLSSQNQTFELMHDIDFSEQFDSNGVPNRTITPVKNSNGKIVKYTVKKYDTIVAGESKIYKQVINAADIKPFMEILLPDKNVMEIESILFKDGTDYHLNPTMNEFMKEEEYTKSGETVDKTDTYRFFEVNHLTEQYRWGDSIYKDGNQAEALPKTYTYDYMQTDNNGIAWEYPVMSITKGEWKPLKQKFITEYTDNGYLKIIFGAGANSGQEGKTADAITDFSKYQISKMINNGSMGVLPKAGWTMFVLYRVGGGAASNVPKGSIKTISLLNMEVGRCLNTQTDATILSAVKNSLKVTNTTPSVSGKDAPTVDEIRAMIKYNSGAQERCVTLKDYESCILKMPPRYGSAFRLRAVEENNKVMLYLLGIDNEGKLTDEIPEKLSDNISNYLSMYRTINDYVEIKSGRIINVSIEADIYVDKNYNKGDVGKSVVKTITSYMDINKHQMGEDIFIGDLEKEISKIDGVINLTDMRVFNEYGTGYSGTRTSQTIMEEETEGQSEMDLEANDYILNSEPDEMFELKYPESDIRLRIKTR